MLRLQLWISVLVLILQFIVAVYSTGEGIECSANCTLKDGNQTTGPPTMKFKTVSRSVVVKSSLALHCKICHSNPVASLAWFFNGKPFHLKKDRMYNISNPCQQTLYLLTVLSEDDGNYTCVAKNKFGVASSTTKVKIIGRGCSNECLFINGTHKVSNKRLGPPRMLFKQQVLANTINSMVKITCQLCESNPPSTLRWYFNGGQLDLKSRKMQVISGACKETLYFQASKTDYAGNYTCMVKNDFGQTNLTTELQIYDTRDESKPSIDVKLEAEAGTFSGNDVKIDSHFNITCELFSADCLAITWSWKKNGKVIRQNETKGKKDNHTNGCTSKLLVDKAIANSIDKYQCSAKAWSVTYINAISSSENISINVVPCFKGFYCPPNAHKARRCPNGTFTMHQNATNLTQCEPCPNQKSKNENFLPFQSMNPETAKAFRINCPVVAENSHAKSSLSGGEITAIAVSSVLIIVIVIVASWLGMRSCREYKRLVQRPPGKIQIEIPDVPQSKDVFVCYSSKNRQWVHEVLFPKLKAQDFETFIDFVDFEIGLPIHQNIVNGIYGSRKTIFVLSQDSLRSYYARTELSQALVAGRQTGHQVIVILYEKCKVPEEISNIVYLDWTDEEKRGKFWDKLFEAVRKSPGNEVEA